MKKLSDKLTLVDDFGNPMGYGYGYYLCDECSKYFPRKTSEQNFCCVKCYIKSCNKKYK